MASMIIEQCQVAPPSGGTAELMLPLTYFDHMWLLFGRMRRILFYKLPVSKLDFVQTIIPTLKDSLSLALKHYTPLAGKVACPRNLDNGYPELRYVTGDSVSVTFSESDMDFNYLIGDHPRNAKDFYHFVPQLAEPEHGPGVQLAPVLAIQVTLFPNLGLSIGFSNYHVACDGNTMVKFIRSWALLNKSGGDEQCLAKDEYFIPSFDRSVIKDPHRQGTVIWDEMKQNLPEMLDTIVIPLDKVRGTFIIRRDDIVKLKNLILSRRPTLSYNVTSFTVTCAYVWTCLVKSKSAIGENEEIDDDVMDLFGCVADCRSRLNPPLPESYFGNCLITLGTKASRVDLVGKEGFTIAAELIGETLQKHTKDEEMIMSCDWYREFCSLDMSQSLTVSGSPKFNLYIADFGWGRPEKVEFISIDSDNGICMSLSKHKDFDGDLEVGLSLPKTLMAAFASLFTHGLSFL